MVTPKKILIQDLELADEEIRRLREENKSLKKKVSELEDVSKDYDILSKDFIELGEENKKLKSDLSECECSMHFENDEVGYRKRECKKLKEENAKLKFDIEARKELKKTREKKEQKLQIEIGGLMGERDGLKIAVDKLKEENQTLELWLDNKEKLNEEYRKQLDKRQQGEYRYFGNDGESDLYEDV